MKLKSNDRSADSMTPIDKRSTFLRQSYGALLFLAFAATASCGDDDDTGPTTGGGAASGNSGAGTAAKGGTGGKSSGGDGSEGGALTLTKECAVLGELCHVVDDKDGPRHDCHELGHVGDATACHQQFPSCIQACLADPAEAGEGGSSTGAEGGELADLHCAALGELCHAGDDQDGPVHDCHALGHRGDPEACRSQFDVCATACLAALAELETPDEHGNGGAAAGAGAAGAAVAGAGAATAGLGGEGSR